MSGIKEPLLFATLTVMSRRHCLPRLTRVKCKV